MKIVLTGSKKYLTANPTEYVYVESGTVYVYVVNIENDVIGRSIFLTEISESCDIPTLSAADPARTSFYQFLIIAAEEAGLDLRAEDGDREKRRESFLEKTGLAYDRDKGFSETVIEWYQNKLIDEEETIRNRKIEQNKVRENKVSLMGSVFRNSRSIIFEENTESALYNVISVYCDYLNIDICSYQSLVSSCGTDFTINDIARMSHFVVRKVRLKKDWYRHADEAFVAFNKTGNTPVICIPGNRGRYIMYDYEKKNSTTVDEVEASWLDDEAFVAYEHLPYGKLKLTDVIKYGLKHVNRSDMASFCIMYLLTTLVGLLLPMLNEMLYDKLIPLSQPGPVEQIGMVMFCVMVGNLFFLLVQNLASFRGVKKVEYSIMAASYDRLFRLPQSFVESFGTTELLGRINAIPAVFSSTVSSGVSALMGMILSLFYLWKMFDKSSVLAFRGMMVTVISGVIMYFFGRLRIDPERERLKKSTDAGTILYQLIAGILKIKISGIENLGLYEYQKSNTEALKYETKSVRINQIGNAVTTLISMLYTGLIYYTVVKKRQELSLGEYTAFNAAYGMFTSAAHQLIGFFLANANLIPAMDRIKPLYEHEVENSEAATKTGPLDGSIEVNHIDFSYNGESLLILKDISFRVSPGEYIGIVGPSGCGKSTLLKCMLGFEKPTKGKIYYDDKDIDNLDKCDLRRRMGVVLQDGHLVMGNIRTNITLASPDMDMEAIGRLLDDVGLKDDINQMPMGIYTNVSEGGGTVSGGQKQRILIARALANDPRIVMFDEATSALDNITQQKVCETLAERNMTRIMIAHRLSTVKNCDRILVMDDGRIVETGNYAELMEKKGLFYELAKRQQV